MRTWMAALVIACLGAALPADAQSRFFLTVGAGAQVSKNTLDRDTAPTFYAEPGSVHQHFRMPMGARIEAGAGIRFSRIEIGGSVGMYRRNGTLDVTAGIPHPFFFGQPRPAALSDPAHRSVVDINIEVTLRLFRWRTMSVSAGAGPTYARLTQDIETALNLTDLYPYDTVAIQSFAMSTVKGSGVGGHAFVTASYPLRRRLLADGVIRYTSIKASTPMEPGASDVRWPVGGVQIVGALRILFGR